MAGKVKAQRRSLASLANSIFCGGKEPCLLLAEPCPVMVIVKLYCSGSFAAKAALLTPVVAPVLAFIVASTLGAVLTAVLVLPVTVALEFVGAGAQADATRPIKMMIRVANRSPKAGREAA